MKFVPHFCPMQRTHCPELSKVGSQGHAEWEDVVTLSGMLALPWPWPRWEDWVMLGTCLASQRHREALRSLSQCPASNRTLGVTEQDSAYLWLLRQRKFFNFCFNKMHNYAFLKEQNKPSSPVVECDFFFFCKVATRVMTLNPTLAVFLHRKSRERMFFSQLNKHVLWETGTAGGTQILETVSSKQIWKK